MLVLLIITIVRKMCYFNRAAYSCSNMYFLHYISWDNFDILQGTELHDKQLTPNLHMRADQGSKYRDLKR